MILSPVYDVTFESSDVFKFSTSYTWLSFLIKLTANCSSCMLNKTSQPHHIVLDYRHSYHLQHLLRNRTTVGTESIQSYFSFSF